MIDIDKTFNIRMTRGDTFYRTLILTKNGQRYTPDSNVGIGELSTGIPANAAYIRITSVGSPDEHELSLIRTA